MKRALVCGAGGFIGHHLVRHLKREGYWVLGVDLKFPEFCQTEADEFWISDLTASDNCDFAVSQDIDEVYQLAANMGGMGFLPFNETEIMRQNSLININMIHSATSAEVPKYFYSSSACVYRDMPIGSPEIPEEGAYPAMPDNEYGWEKLYAERVCMAYARKYPKTKVRIARFQNTYGPEGTWKGGREKAPAAICRKVAEANEENGIEVWGDGSAVRSYTYIDDLIRGISYLMDSELEGPVNIGSPQLSSVIELVQTVMLASNKNLPVKWVDGPVGVQSRNFSLKKIESTGWKSYFSLIEGISFLYRWVSQQVESQT